MKKYLNSDISCFVNAMLVVLILLASSCSSNWKLAYLKTDEPRKMNADYKLLVEQHDKNDDKNDENTQSSISNENEVEDNDGENGENDDYSFNEKKEAGQYVNQDGDTVDVGYVLQEIKVIAKGSTRIRPNKDGYLIFKIIFQLPKDILSPQWQIRLHPKIFISQNKNEFTSYYTNDVHLTGSEYRDKQMIGYEKYSNFLSKLDTASYNTTINISKVLKRNKISNYVNKYQLEYLLMRNFPDLYKNKDGFENISDDQFINVLGIDKDSVINHYYSDLYENRISKLSSQKDDNFKTFVYNPIPSENVDTLVIKDTLLKFDNLYLSTLEKIKADSLLSAEYFAYIDSLKKGVKQTYPELKSEYFVKLDRKLDSIETHISKNYPSNHKDSIYRIKRDSLISALNTNEKENKFKLDYNKVIIEDDTVGVFLVFHSDSIVIKASDYPKIDKVSIEISGDIYNDTTHLAKFSMPGRLESPITSVASFADTTEIVYDTTWIERKANHGANYKIEFEKNSALLKESLGNNGEMIQKIKSDLEALMKNAEFDLDSIIVSATASPEGAITVNQRFSGQRSDAVSNYFRNYIESNKWKYRHEQDSIRQDVEENIASIQASELNTEAEKQEMISDQLKRLDGTIMPNIEFKVHPIPENWDDLYNLIGMDSIMSYDEKNLFYDTYEKINNPDVRENTMKKHSYYNYMSKEIYPKIRVVKFDFHMHRKGQEMERIPKLVPSKEFINGVNALKDLDFIEAERILSQYKSYNTAIMYILRERPLLAINILEAPELEIDFEYYKTKRDSLTKIFVSLDSSAIAYKDSINTQIKLAKDTMDRVAKLEFLKAKAYFMRFLRNQAEDPQNLSNITNLNKAINSYLFLIRMDNLNGLYSRIMTGTEITQGAIFGSNSHYDYLSKLDEHLGSLPTLSIAANAIEKYKEKLKLEFWYEKKKYFTEKEWAEYNELKNAYQYDTNTEEELEKMIMESW